ncbi:DUF7224 domain-containing protein [Streptomyces nodosus]|uniref:DUF7224 domain-containing protein n=1 Tax=Streptomyces nodosus TaxID=40318 RepID=UPI0037FF209D
MTGLLVELRRTPVRWAAPPLLAACTAMVFLVGGDWRGSWPETSAAATRAAIPLMVAGTGIAAERASRLRRSGAEALLAARPPHQVELARLTADAVWLGAVYLLCTAFTWIATAGAPGGPWLDYVLFGVSGVVFALALGHFIGRSLPGRFTGALAAVGGFLLFSLVFGSQSSPLADVVFYHAIDVRLSATHLVWRLAITGLAVAAMCTVSSLLSRDWRSSGAAGAAGFFSLATLVCVVAMPGSDSALLETRRAGTPVCEAGGGGTVCVWPEHAHRLPEAVAAADRVARAARGVVPAPERYAEQGLERDGTGGFTLDHGRKDLLHTMLLELTGPHQTWCETELEDLAERRVYAGLRLETWLEARATDSGKLPAYTYSGDTAWLSDVRRARKLPTAEQVSRAKEWARDMAAPC